MNQSPKKVKLYHVSKYFAAACLVGLSGAATSQHARNKTQENNNLVCEKYFSPLQEPGVTADEDTTAEESKAISAYEREDYFAAVKYYEKLVDIDPKNVKNNLILGISLLATNQQKKAVAVLSSITSSELYHFDIQWYLALAYIKNKDIENAIPILKILSGEENYYNTEANEILEKIKERVR